MIISGKNMMVYVQGNGLRGDTDKNYPIACDRNCSLNIQSDFQEITTKDSGYMRAFLPSLVRYSISGDGLTDFSKVMGTISLQQRILAREILTFKFQAKESDTEAIIYSGQGFLQNVAMGAPVNGGSTFSYQLIGSGALEIDNTIPIEGGGGQPTEDMAQVYRGQFIATNGQTTYQDNALIGATLLWLSVAGEPLYDGAGNYQMAGLDPVNGTITWNYPTANGNECIYLYKK